MQLHVSKIGEGKRELLVFHGIGQTGEQCFGSMARQLADHYTTYLFDLPFHGESRQYFEEKRWDDGKTPITGSEWRGYLDGFLQEHGIERFSIAGFSIGGRFALSTAADFGDRLDHVFLIAPDGVVDQPLYRLATSTAFFRRIFFNVIRRPGILLKIAGGMQFAGLAHAGLKKIVGHLTSTTELSDTVYRSWVNFRRLGLELVRGKSGCVAALTGKVHIFLGVYDFLVKERDVLPLIEMLPDSNVMKIKAGHGSVVEHSVPDILKITLTGDQ